MIGVGGSATVYKARQDGLGRTVAVKVFSVRVGPKAQAAFEDECQAAGRLSKHPNIVTVFDSGIADGRHPYLLMEHYERGSLHSLVAGWGPVPVGDVLRFGVRLSGALAAAHAGGVLHRDVTPANVFLSEFDEPMLGDFGIASVRAEGPAIAGFTPDYSAPEVLVGSPSTPASDLFGLSATLYHLLVGVAPQERVGDEPYELMGARLRAAPRPVLAGLAPEVDRALLAGLEPDPAHRPASAVDMGRAIQAVQRSLGFEVTDLPGLPSSRGVLTVASGSRPTTTAPEPPTEPPGDPAGATVRLQAAVVDVALSLAITATGVLVSQAVPAAPLPTLASVAVGAAGVQFLYHALFAGLVGPSLGRWVVGLELNDGHGQDRVDAWRALLRALVGLGAVLPVGAGYLGALRPPFQTWPDLVSGTRVERRTVARPAGPIFLALTVVVLIGASLAVVAVHLG